jgi:hypothetical protein
MASYNALRQARTPTSNYPDERYLLNGLNMVTPDDLIANGESPYTINTRMFARESGEKRVAIRTRKGPGFYSVPVGEAIDQQQTSVAGAANLTFNQTHLVASKFVAGNNNLLSAVDVNLKSNTGIGTVIMEIRSNQSGLPGTKLAISGAKGNQLVSTYGYVKFRFINPLQLTSGTTYWIVLYSQDDNVNYYHASTTTNTSTAVTSSDGVSWAVQSYSLNFKTYTCTAGAVKGWKRMYFSNGTKYTVFAHGTSLYVVNDVTGVPTAVKTGLNALATRYRFAKSFDDKYVVVNGYDAAFTIDSSLATATLANVPFIPNNVLAWKNRLVFTQPDDPTRYFYSEPAQPTTYPSTNFGYVPAPKTADPITAMLVYQDNLLFFTSETKYVLSGTDISNFTLRQAIGTKGAVGQEAVDNDRNYAYFKADDQIYAFNGVTDTIISDNVQPEVDGFTQDQNTCVCLYNNQVRIYYTPAAQATNSKMLLFNTIYKQWFMDTDAYTTLPSIMAQDTGNPLVEASSVYGALFYAEVDSNNLGAPLDMKYWTSYNKYLSAMSKDRVRKFHPEIRPGDTTFTMQVGKDVDFQNSPFMVPLTVSAGGNLWGASTTVWGSFVWGAAQYQDTPVSLSGRGKHTQYRFERYGANTPVELYGYAALIKSSQLK